MSRVYNVVIIGAGEINFGMFLAAVVEVHTVLTRPTIALHLASQARQKDLGITRRDLNESLRNNQRSSAL